MSWKQTCINPDAPWTTFIDARSRALSAYGLFQDSRRQHGIDLAVTLDSSVAETRSAAQRERLSAAFVRLSLALDRVTVPIQVRLPTPPRRRDALPTRADIKPRPQYWSESPYEAVGSAASHTALVHVLDECELRLRRIADKDSAQGEVPRALDGRHQEVDDDEDSLESLTAWMVRPLLALLIFALFSFRLA